MSELFFFPRDAFKDPLAPTVTEIDDAIERQRRDRAMSPRTPLLEGQDREVTWDDEEAVETALMELLTGWDEP